MNNIPIIYENDEILIINKPVGLSVQGGEGVSSSVDTVLPTQLGYKVFLVHRLDKETSGLMVVAKSSKAAGKWTNLINQHNVQKEYVALCGGVPKKKSGVFTDSVVQKGREQNAFTEYKLLQSFTIKENNSSDSENQIDIQGLENKSFSLFSLKLGTGRMHQIRIHLSKAGFPIFADDKYGDFKLNKLLQKKLKIKRLCLASVKLTLPIDNQLKTFTIPYPEHIEKAKQSLQDIDLTLCKK
jgi:23S rRNA pseudouridine955/2504/2580 synthase